MTLEEYIKETLVQIVNGVSEAASICADKGAIINPRVTVGDGNNLYILEHGNVNMKRRVQMINMEVSVLASEASELDGQLKAGISVFGTKIDGRSEGQTQNVNRVSFQVPVCLPNQDIE